MAEITDFEQARALKALGVPFNTAVETRKLPKECGKLIRTILKAADKCRSAAYEYCIDQSANNYAKLKRAHIRLGVEIAKIKPPKWIDDERLINSEYAVVEALVAPRCFTAYNQWAEIIANLDAGNEVAGVKIWPTEI